MTTIISGSNRLGNVTHQVSQHYFELMKLKTNDVKLFSLEDLPMGFLVPDMYKSKHPDFLKMENDFIIPAKKIVFVLPEYNGSFPGVLKAFIDACDVKQCFHNKKAALVGIGSGKSGNQRGLDQLTAILNHMKMVVLPARIYVSNVEEQLNEDGKLFQPHTLKSIEKQIDEFISF